MLFREITRAATAFPGGLLRYRTSLPELTGTVYTCSNYGQIAHPSRTD